MTPKRDSGAPLRERLIDVAQHNLQRHGPGALTLDAVAREAGVSKGGLLHHFPSKEALVEAILRHLFAGFEARVNAEYARDPAAPGAWLRAYVRATFATDNDVLPLELSVLLLSALGDHHALLALVREDFKAWADRLENDGIPPLRARVVRQAADAFWSDRLLDIAPETPEERLALMNEVLSLIDGGAR